MTSPLAQLLRPVDGVDVNPEGILPQAIQIAWCLENDREIALQGPGKLTVVIAPFDPGETKAFQVMPG